MCQRLITCTLVSSFAIARSLQRFGFAAILTQNAAVPIKYTGTCNGCIVDKFEPLHRQCVSDVNEHVLLLLIISFITCYYYVHISVAKVNKQRRHRDALKNCQG